MFTRTPTSLTTKILELCHELNPSGQPVFIRITPDPGAELNDCFATVQRKVSAEGGRIQFGWAIWEWPNVLAEAEHHAVYEPPAGLPWADLSPLLFKGSPTVCSCQTILRRTTFRT